MRQKDKTCKTIGCDLSCYCKNYCRKHYGEEDRKGTFGRQPCNVPGCIRLRRAYGMCSMHRVRLLKFGDVGDPNSVKKPDGHGHVTKHGYKNITVDGVHYAEHRYVMEQFLGRKLFSHENVHHKNGNRSDNRIENLELWSSSQPAGQRVEDKLEWAKQIIEQYSSLSLT